jgi:tetratricopeptide (TPR) repeat protein
MARTVKARPAKAPTTPDPIEIAMVAEAGGVAPDGQASLLLADQRRLIQAEVLQRRGLFAVLVLAGFLVFSGLGAMVWSASRANGVVIDPLVAPADLAQAGHTGEALASQLKDKFLQMSAETLSRQAGAEVQDARSADVRVEFAGTAISLDELDRLLRGWLGDEVHVGGEVVRVLGGAEAGALAMSVRVSGRPGVRLVQADGDLDALIGRAAEWVFAARTPIRHAQWLVQKGRIDDARAALNGIAARGTRPERAQAYLLLAESVFVSNVDREPFLRESLRLLPSSAALAALGSMESSRGHSEAAIHYWRRAVALRGQSKELVARADTLRLLNTLEANNLALALGEYATAQAVGCLLLDVEPCSERELAQASVAVSRGGRLRNGADYTEVDRLPFGVRTMAARHAVEEAAAIAATHPESTPAWVSARTAIAREREDWAAVLAESQALQALRDAGKASRIAYDSTVWAPLALAKLGRFEEAERLAASSPLDCVPCVVIRARVAAERRDWRTADHWFGEAVRMAPSSPFAEVDWAWSLLARGRAADAAAHAEAGARKGPKFADAHEVWGEALLAKGDAKRAAEKLETAARITPSWGRAQLKWGEALAKLGKTDEARAKWRAAAGMALTPAERARVEALLVAPRA